jgi:hypothetical protein
MSAADHALVGSSSLISADRGSRKLRLVSMTPFGNPVVPEVYICRQTSSSAEGTLGSETLCRSRQAA